MRAAYLLILLHPLLSSGGQFHHFPVITGKSNILVPGERVGGRQPGVRKVKKNGDIQDLIDFVSDDTENVETVRSRVMIGKVVSRHEDKAVGKKPVEDRTEKIYENMTQDMNKSVKHITRTRNISRHRVKTDRKQPKARATVLLNLSSKNDVEKVSISMDVATKPIVIRERRKRMNNKNKKVAMAKNKAMSQEMLPEQLLSKNRNVNARRRVKTVVRVRS